MSTPLQDKCAFCNKNKVTSHHRLCDECWGEKAQKEHINKLKRIAPKSGVKKRRLKRGGSHKN